MLVILTPRLSTLLDWFKNVAGYDGVDYLAGTVKSQPEAWLTSLAKPSVDAVVRMFPHLTQWLPADQQHSFLWLSNVGASGQDEVRRALTDADADVEVCVMGLVHAPVKTVSCRRTTAPPESLPRYKSYRLVRVATPKPPLRVAATTVYLSRHGESEFNVLGKVGGDAVLSPRGRAYGRRLAEFVNTTLRPRIAGVWTSTLRRTVETAAAIAAPKERLAELNELGSGRCEGLTYEEIAEFYPAEFAARDADKFHYRYPGGESYADLVQRVRPVVERLKGLDNIFIIAHQAVIRCLLAALLSRDEQQLPYINTPLHTVMRVHCVDSMPAHLEMIPLHVDCVDTHRHRPQNVSVDRTLAEALVTVPAHYTHTSNLLAEAEKKPQTNVDSISF